MARVKSKIEISLTDFVDFVCKSGNAKLTKVREIKRRDAYSPATDFYKALREGIINIHANNEDRKELKTILNSVSDPKKIKNYTVALEGYKKYWGKKKFVWFTPPRKHWIVGNLDIRINPELGLQFNDNFYVIKLYLKSDNLSKDKISQILTLMEKQLRKSVEKEIKFAVLDVKNSKIFIKEDSDISLVPLLDGEAKCFEIMWDGIKL
ncbi:MAG: hypothetical protein RL660_298 [Bacteroidota bacterium]|jgi:hypothetical protein